MAAINIFLPFRFNIGLEIAGIPKKNLQVALDRTLIITIFILR